jgi:hypothetical protein
MAGRPLWILRKSDPVTAARLNRLGVTSLWSQRPTLKHPPGFYLMPESWGGWEPGPRRSLVMGYMSGSLLTTLQRPGPRQSSEMSELISVVLATLHASCLPPETGSCYEESGGFRLGNQRRFLAFLGSGFPVPGSTSERACQEMSPPSIENLPVLGSLMAI